VRPQLLIVGAEPKGGEELRRFEHIANAARRFKVPAQLRPQLDRLVSVDPAAGAGAGTGAPMPPGPEIPVFVAGHWRPVGRKERAGQCA
jgi:hypothetical protein